MLKFQITDPDLFERKWNDKNTGLPRSMNLQSILVYLPDTQGKTDTYDKIEMIIGDNQKTYPVGLYTFSPRSFYIDKNNRLQISMSNLVPLIKQQP